MFYEYALISVLIACGYWGVFFLRRQPNGTPTFGLMQVGAAALAGLGLLGRTYEGSALDIAGAIGLGAGVCLLVVGPVIRAVARRFASAEHLGVASRLLDLAEILGPGSGVAEEKAVLGAMKEIRDGHIEETVDALTAAKDRAPADARLAIDERIALLYLAAYRWSDAIAHAEAHLFGAISPASTAPLDPPSARQGESAAEGDDDGEEVAEAAHDGAPRSLRSALGLAPPVWVELLGAYGRTGDLDQAARMLARLEDVCADRDDAAIWIHRARLMFLALAGRPASVQALVEPRRARHMSVAARTYWVAVAHHHHGDREAATAAYHKARGRARGRPRELIDQALARLAHPEGHDAGVPDDRARGAAPGGEAETPAGSPGRDVEDPARAPGRDRGGEAARARDQAPRRGDSAPTDRRGPDAGAPLQLSPIASEVVARVEAAPLPAPVRLPRRRVPWATWSVTALLFGVAGLIAFAVGPTSDPGVLVRAGAMVRGFIDAGEWWRLVTCIFVHFGAVHLVVNAIGMFFLGRVAEELFGTARTIALFGLAGLAGAVASYLASPAGMSAGASGAIFGLLGAVFVELTFHRDRYRAAWKRGMWGGLVVVTVAQVGVGFVYPVIDQWAHGAGLLAGAVFGVLLSPSTKWNRIAVHAGRAIALMFGAFALTAGVLVARTSVAESLAAAPRARHVIGEVAVTAPAAWVADGELADPDGLVIMTLHREPLIDAIPQMMAWIVKSSAIAKGHGFDRVETASDRVVALPQGWEGSERIGSFEDAMGARQRYRLVIAGRAFGDTLVLVVAMTPDSIARAAPAFVAQLIASTGPAGD